jgi:hypothetical protein
MTDSQHTTTLSSPWQVDRFDVSKITTLAQALSAVKFIEAENDFRGDDDTSDQYAATLTALDDVIVRFPITSLEHAVDALHYLHHFGRGSVLQMRHVAMLMAIADYIEGGDYLDETKTRLERLEAIVAKRQASPLPEGTDHLDKANAIDTAVTHAHHMLDVAAWALVETNADDIKNVEHVHRLSSLVIAARDKMEAVRRVIDADFGALQRRVDL